MDQKIVFQPSGSVCRVESGTTLLQCARDAGIQLSSYCGGGKTCGKCQIKVLRGNFAKHRVVSGQDSFSPVTAEERKIFTSEQLKEGYRLACCAVILKDAVVEIPEESRMQKQVILEEGKNGAKRDGRTNPAVKNCYVELDKATLRDNRDDLTRVRDALKAQWKMEGDLEIDYAAIGPLSEAIRDGDWKLTVYVLNDQKIIGAVSGRCECNYGVAVDIGTTTVAVYLCELQSGKTLATGSFMNPQVGYGDDVISRISYCQEEPQGLKTMQTLMIDQLNQCIAELAGQQKIKADQISEAVLVFNTVMEFITLGINPAYIGVSPFIAPVRQGMDLPARELGLHLMPGANVHCLPSEASFVGADNVAVLISQEPYNSERMQLIIDIGTNSEICLGNRKGLYVTSCATGPALEGAQIKWGMRAARGAIEAVQINPVTLEPELKVIGGKDTVPVGICGSGILDAVAQMAVTGILQPDGRFTKVDASPRIRTGDDGKREYVLYYGRNPKEHDITVNIQDIRAVQLAKAALYAGAKMLMAECGIQQVDEVILAGAFGSFIDKENALALGLFPDCEYEKIKVVGNAAGVGARLALLNRKKRKEAEEVAAQVTFVETAARDEFQKCFTAAMGIPHKKDAFPLNRPMVYHCTEIHEAVGTTVDGKYPFENLDELRQVGFTDEMAEKIISGNSRRNLPGDMVDVSSPLSVLSNLISPVQLYREARRNPDLLQKYLDQAMEYVTAYSRSALEQGAVILSYADSTGVLELTGMDFYRKFSGRANQSYFKQMEEYLHHGLIHICGKTSYSMEKCGFMRAKPWRVEKDMGYVDLLREYAKMRKMKYIGHACINRDYPKTPIIYQLELV